MPAGRASTASGQASASRSKLDAARRIVQQKALMPSPSSKKTNVPGLLSSVLALSVGVASYAACQSGKAPEPEPTTKKAETKPAASTPKSTGGNEAAKAEKKPRPQLREPVFKEVHAK